MITTNYVPGAPIWVDLMTPDVDAAADFYNSLFTWRALSAGPEAGGYGMFLLDGQTVGAYGPPQGEDTAPAWSVYFHTADGDATAAAVQRAGGTVAVSPLDVFDQGRMAGFVDPTGAYFAVWQPGANKGLDLVSAPNALCWAELHTTDQNAAKGFYRAVFGWQTQDTSMPEFTYTVVRPRGAGEDGDVAGIMPLGDVMAGTGRTSSWLPYFAVADCDAAATTADKKGGAVIMPPEDLPGVGRIAALADPFGARFSVLTPQIES